MQFGNLLSIRTRRRSIIQSNPISGPTRNLYLFGAMLISVIATLVILYVPFFNNIFNTRYVILFFSILYAFGIDDSISTFQNNPFRPIPIQFYFIPLGFSIFILIIDEIRKLLVRTYPKSLLCKLAW